MRIATGLLAVVGAFFLILQVLWFAKVEVAWLPYVAHGLGAFLAGAAMVRAAPQLSLHEAFITGIVAIATLAVITWTLPKAFLLTAADPANRYTILPIVVAGSGLSCMGGAWLFRTANVTQLWIGVLAAFVTTCAVQLGLRFGSLVGVPLTTTAVTLEMFVLAGIAGAATQLVVGPRAVVSIAIGAAGYAALQLAIQLKSNTPYEVGFLVALGGIIGGAALGAYVSRR